MPFPDDLFRRLFNGRTVYIQLKNSSVAVKGILDGLDPEADDSKGGYITLDRRGTIVMTSEIAAVSLKYAADEDR